MKKKNPSKGLGFFWDSLLSLVFYFEDSSLVGMVLFLRLLDKEALDFKNKVITIVNTGTMKNKVIEAINRFNSA
jgi:ABC-type enterochelin transport system permease subunit